MQPNNRNNFSKSWGTKKPFSDPCASYRSPVLHAKKFDPLIVDIHNAGEPRPTPTTDDFPPNYPSDADDEGEASKSESPRQLMLNQSDTANNSEVEFSSGDTLCSRGMKWDLQAYNQLALLQ